MLAHVRQHGVAVDARHHQVEKDDVVAVAVEALDRFDAVARRVDADSLMPHDRGKHRPDGVVIIDDQCPGL